MEWTWEADEQSKFCYIYDWKHDDSPNMNIGMTYENTTKTPIDAKILVSKYGSIDKDSPTLQCQFKPSQKEYFTEEDDLFYMEEYRKKYQLDDIFVGMYLDVPDKKGVYHRHLICMKDVEQNFQKYFILPCDYNLQFVVNKGNQRTKQHMWCVLKSQSSYNSGLWTDYIFTTQQNQEILFIPTNEISDAIYYVSESNENNQRLIVDIPNYSIDNWTPNTWVVSKVERVNVRGRTKLTLYQKSFNSSTDYIEKDENGHIIGMWASYFDSEIAPTDPSTSTTPIFSITAKVSASTPTIKVGGSYKSLTVNLFDNSNEDITIKYSDTKFSWICSIDNEDWTDKVTWRDGTEFNQIKIKFPNDSSVIGKILSIKCTITKDNLPIESEVMQFNLIE